MVLQSMHQHLYLTKLAVLQENYSPLKSGRIQLYLLCPRIWFESWACNVGFLLTKIKSKQTSNLLLAKDAVNAKVCLAASNSNNMLIGFTSI